MTTSPGHEIASVSEPPASPRAEPPAPADAAIDLHGDAWRLEQVRLLYSSLPPPLAASAVVAAILAAAQSAAIGPARTLTWLGIFGTVTAGRAILAFTHRPDQTDASNSAIWLNRFRIGTALAGLTWGLGALMLFPPGDPLRQAFLVFAIAGVCAGATTTLAADRLSLLGFAAPPLAVTIFQFLSMGGGLDWLMATMIALYGGFLAINASRSYRWLTEISQLRVDEAQRADRLKGAEQRLRELNAALERRVEERTGELLDAIQSMAHAILLFDRDDRVIVFNDRFIELFPEVAGDIKVGAGFEESFRAIVERGGLVLPPDRDMHQYVAERVAQHRRADGSLIVCHRPDARVIHTTEHPARNGGTIVICIDVTESLKTEEHLREAQKLEAIGKLTGGMAHDFNNYLAVIIGNLDLVKSHQSIGAEAMKMIDSALRGALRAAELTRSLLAYSRRQPLDPRVTDVNQRLATITKLLTRTLGEDIVLSERLAPDLWPVRVDGAQLDSCIVNLATNARDAMAHGGSLIIATANTAIDQPRIDGGSELAPGDYVEIEVTDTGVGMSPEAAARAFEPFFTTKGPGHGTGLGLSMVYGFVKQSGGHISIDSELGQGTTVRIYLPRHGKAPADDISTDAPARALPTGSETILIVEDNDQMRQTAAAQLRALGYKVVEASSGSEAIAILKHSEPRPDLVFTDIVMPGRLDGYGVARVVAEKYPGIKIVLTSGFPGDLRDGHAAAPFLGKPYRREQLARTIRAALDSTPA
jgi:signal transduction histidine kinase